MSPDHGAVRSSGAHVQMRVVFAVHPRDVADEGDDLPVAGKAVGVILFLGRMEYTDGERVEEYDNGLCPFDLSKPVLELSDEDFGFWYTDCMDNPERYEGKSVRFRGMVAKSDKFPKGCYAVGRFAMVCCAEDTTFLGVLCNGSEQRWLNNKDWVDVTAKVRLKRLPIYHGEKGPVLYTTEVKPTEPPKDPLVYY